MQNPVYEAAETVINTYLLYRIKSQHFLIQMAEQWRCSDETITNVNCGRWVHLCQPRHPISFWAQFWLFCIKKIPVHTRNVVWHILTLTTLLMRTFVVFKALWATTLVGSEIFNKCLSMYTEMTTVCRRACRHEWTHGFRQYAQSEKE